MQGLYPGRIEIWKCWFLWREGNQRTRRKTLGARREPTTNSTHIWHRAGIEPGQHWWEASALTTAPSLLSMFDPWSYTFWQQKPYLTNGFQVLNCPLSLVSSFLTLNDSFACLVLIICQLHASNLSVDSRRSARNVSYVVQLPSFYSRCLFFFVDNASLQ